MAIDKYQLCGSGDDLLTVPEAACRLGVTPACIRAWVLRRKLPYVKINRLVRIQASVIDRLVADNTIPARGEAKADGRPQ